jgi:two-component system, chemotaxis family, sensor kinase CheA
MESAALIKSIDDLASELVFLPGREIDIPAAGALMNHIEGISGKSLALGVPPLTEVARTLNQLLEMMVLDTLKEKDLGFETFEKGIALMQAIAAGIERDGAYRGDTHPFLAAVSTLTGTAAGGTGPAPDRPQPPPAPPAPEAGPQVQDLSLLTDFIAEGLEYIDEIEVNILNLEQDPGNRDYINAIFRPFHSVKGVASFLNLEEIRQLAHNLENLLDKARNEELKVTPPLIDLILDGTDVLKAMILRLKDEIANRPVKPLSVDLAALTQRIRNAEKPSGTIDNPRLGEILVSGGVITTEELDEVLDAVQKTPEKKIGKALIEGGKATPKQVSQALRTQGEKSADASTLRVDTRKLDDLIDMVGELVITQSMIQQDLSQQGNASKNLIRDISQFFRITSSLQRTSMRLRMIPIKQTFQRMSRLVRDLAKSSGKAVNVEVSGEETEIDRNMVDEIYNPLVHMVRNAVDHGLEPPEERLRAGKPERGLIHLSAYHRGGNIVIEISDDGRGLNRGKILDKALKNGIVSDIKDLTDQEAYQLILLPGLSTAEKITDVSGRGVGMDVVKQAVEKLRGKIEIDSRLGAGTKFSTSFPLTLAIIDGMLVQVGRETYIIPTTAIRKTLRPARSDYSRVAGKGEMLNVMGQLLPMIKLYELFDIEPEHREPWEGIVVVVEGETQSPCLLVDKIIGKAEVVIKSLGADLKHIKGVSGGAILGDGRIGLILDPEGLFELNDGR